MTKPLHLLTAENVIDFLGGPTATGTITGHGRRAVSNWKLRGRFPPQTWEALTRALQLKGAEAPKSLWGIVETRIVKDPEEGKVVRPVAT